MIIFHRLAVLTAAIKSLKVLTAMKKTQDTQVKQLNDIAEKQAKLDEKIKLLDDMASKSDIDTLAQSLIVISDSVGTIVKEGSEAEDKIIKAIDETDSSTNLEIIKKLVQGMTQVHKNMVTLSNHMTDVNNSMQAVHKDSETLSDIMARSNSRIQSMDMRMAAFLNVADEDHADNVDDALKLLENLSDDDKNTNIDINKNVKFVSPETKKKHQELRTYEKELDNTLTGLDALSSGDDNES